MLSEAEGRAVLKRVFERRGFAIAEHATFAEGNLRFTPDGWDAAARVGYEYLTHASDDHHDLTAEELSELERRMEDGALYVLVVDENAIEAAEDLVWAAERFLDEVARRHAAAAPRDA